MSPNKRLDHQDAITLIELMIVIAILSLILGVATSNYLAHLKELDFLATKRCMLTIQHRVERYYSKNFDYPAAMDELSISHECLTDPWGNPYQYYKIAGSTGRGNNRKDRSENPLNSDYDLYSMGADGDSRKSLRPKASHDDIIRAKNGYYIGYAADY